MTEPTFDNGRPTDTPTPRVTLTEGGPILVEGPVELETPDGATVRSDRPVVAVCACRRSKRYPFCDTSHRRKERISDSRNEENRAEPHCPGAR